MSFVNPGYLFALAGLIVPLAIHLWSRKEGQVVKIGSLQFLPGGDTKKASSIQLNEITLLMLRLLLIALLVLAMAEPLYMREIDANSRAVFIDPSVKNVPWVKTVIDSLKENNENAHWFTPGFPTLTTDSINEDTWYWQLAGDLQDFPAANITVITGNQLAKTVGKRPTLNRTISWIIADNTNKSNEFLVEATLRGDSVNTRFGFSDNESTFFQLKKVAKADFRTKHGIQKLIKDTLYVVIHAEKDFAVEKKYFTKAFETIEDYTHWPIKQLTYQNITQKDTIDWLVWLGEGSPGNASARYNIFYDESVMPESQSLLAKGSKRGDYFLTERLNINNVEERKFIRNLFELIRQRSFDFDSIIQQNDLRAIDDEQLLPDMQKLESNRLQAKTPVSSYLWMAFLIVLAVERILSAIRKQ